MKLEEAPGYQSGATHQQTTRLADTDVCAPIVAVQSVAEARRTSKLLGEYLATAFPRSGRLARARTPLINRKLVRLLSLEIAAATGRGKFKRVSNDFLEEANAHLHAWIAGRIHRAPSLGKTL